MSGKKPVWFPLLGLGFALAGADKMFGQSGYRRLFRDLGLSEQAMRVVGLGEFAGGVLVSSANGRRLGGLLLTMASTAVLTSELRKGADQLAMPRAALLLAAVAAAAMPTPSSRSRTSKS